MGDSRVRVLGWTLFLAGLALFTALLAWQGLGHVLAALERAGPWILVVALLHVLPLALDAVSWYVLLPRGERPRLAAIAYVRWIGESVNTLLPVAQVGGDVVRVRLVMRRGVPGGAAAASAVVHVTLGLLTMIVYAVLAALALAALGRDGVDWRAGALGLAALAACLCGFYLAQRRGLFRGLARIAGRFATEAALSKLSVGAAAVDAAVGRTYARRRDVLAGALWRLAAWVSGALEVWLALRILGAPVSFDGAFVVEGLVQVARMAGFAIPGMLGVQEASYVLACGALGISGEIALALALLRRARELLLGLPGLVAWQIEEARRAASASVPRPADERARPERKGVRASSGR